MWIKFDPLGFFWPGPSAWYSIIFFSAFRAHRNAATMAGIERRTFVLNTATPRKLNCHSGRKRLVIALGTIYAAYIKTYCLSKCFADTFSVSWLPRLTIDFAHEACCETRSLSLRSFFSRYYVELVCTISSNNTKWQWTPHVTVSHARSV